MVQRRVVGLALLALLAGTVVFPWRDDTVVVRTIGVNAVLMALDQGASALVVAGNDAAGGQVVMLDAPTGATRRTVAIPGGVTPGGELTPSSAIALDESAHRAYVTTFRVAGTLPRAFLDVVDTRRGVLVRAVGLALPPVALAVDARAGRVVVVTAANATMSVNRNRSSVAVFDASTGAPIHETAVAGANSAAVDEQEGHIFVTAQAMDTNGNSRGAGAILVLDSTSGRVLRTVPVGQNPHNVIVDARTQRVFVLSTPNQPPYRGHLIVLDAPTGAILRRVTLGSIATLALLDGVGSHLLSLNTGDEPGMGSVNAGSVNVLDAHRGSIVQTISLRDTPQVLAAAATMTSAGHRDRLFIAAADNSNDTCPTGPSHLLAIDLPFAGHRGRLVRTVPLHPDPWAMAVDTRHGRLFVAAVGDEDPIRSCIPTGYGVVQMVDTQAGRVIRTIPVGVAPVAIIVDERAGRAFVLNAGGDMSVRAADGWSWVPAWIRSRLPFIPVAPRGVRERVAPAGITVLDTTR